ncbi:hypothetical protein BAE44_0005534 [Dichanthelium oligosanthes]|uniref:Large ribosomal subunit protein bL12 oligomerization domain-containing protein n=1 Tax=Dichanthelium oligosanthes TaxID=888268 RepID=A0A1E5W7V0_9POAL|nr:hypothetical protein BAE44_0005534 [Dichanthelium oligosanthes]
MAKSSSASAPPANPLRPQDLVFLCRLILSPASSRRCSLPRPSSPSASPHGVQHPLLRLHPPLPPLLLPVPVRLAPEVLPRGSLGDAIAGLTLEEARNLVDHLQERLGVAAAAFAPGAVVAAPGAGGAGAAEEVAPVEKTEFNVVIEEVPSSARIATIKVVRALNQPRAEGGQGPHRGRGCAPPPPPPRRSPCWPSCFLAAPPPEREKGKAPPARHPDLGRPPCAAVAVRGGGRPRAFQRRVAPEPARVHARGRGRGGERR